MDRQMTTEPLEVSSGHGPLLVLLFAGASFFEGAALYFALAGGYMLAMLLHSAAALILMVRPILLRGRADPPRFRFYCTLAGCLTLFLPVMGILGSAVTYLAVKWVLRQKGLVQEYQAFTGYALEDSRQLLDAEDPRMLLSDELTIEPFLDILSGIDEDLKRGALNMLGRMGTPKAVRLLKRCITDKSTDVRFYAHSTLTKLEEKHVVRIKEIKALADAGGADQARCFLELGKAYSSYADSGLLEGEMLRHYLSLARTAYDKAFQKDRSDPDLLLRMGRIHMETGDMRGAAACFERGLKDDRTAADSVLGLCRIFYDRGDMKTVARLVKRVRPHPDWRTDNPEDWLLFQFWTGPKRVEAHAGTEREA
jgi:tetratricopeptide (TPR) repeat protein